jgi:integrase
MLDHRGTEGATTVSQAGSLYQRADGYWVAAVTLAGKKIVRYGKTKREAQARLTDLLTASSAGTLAAPTRLTLQQWVDQWLAAQATERRPTTIRYYRQALSPVLERVGRTRLDRLSPVQLSLAFTEMRQSGRGSRATQQAYVVLGTCLRQAVQLGIIGASPLDRVEKPRHEPGEQRRWSPEEARVFFDAARQAPHRYAPLFLLLVASGLRIGEALGLRWEDVDLGRNVVHVRRAYVYAGSRGSLQPTKTRAGQRTVELPAEAGAALLRLPRPLDPTAPVFVTANGTPPRPSDLRKALGRLCARAGVPVTTIHGLRHVHAALLASQGLDPHTLRQRMGHTRVSTTLDLYAYAMRPDSAARAAFERAVSLDAAPDAERAVGES